ncbi:MAG: universal stress protein, partial [Thermoplasmata archaeon]
VRISVKIGKPFVKIVETAKKEGVSLIVMGSHGRSMVKEMFLGSVAEAVIHHATTPVMIVRR